MRIGGFPGQRVALRRRIEEVRREGRELASRRMFLGLTVGGVAGVACGTAGALIGTSAPGSEAETAAPHATGPAPNERRLTPREREAHDLATGPIDRLVHFRSDFLITVNLTARPDRTMWLGVTRLAAVVLDRSHADHDQVWSLLRILEEKKKRTFPDHVQQWFQLLHTRRR